MSVTDTTALISQHGKIMQAMRDRIRGFGLPGITDAEIQVRENIGNEVTGESFQGITIQEKGEVEATSIIGFHDVGFRCLVSFITSKRGDAVMTNDLAMQWRDRVRNEFQVQRLRVGEPDGVRHHNCKIETADPPNFKAFPDWNIRNLMIVVWDRVPFITERTARP